jgi:phosphoserine phosphatase
MPDSASTVVTLIAPAAGPRLDDASVDDVRARLNAVGGEAGPPDWLAEGVACDLAVAGLAPDVAEAAAHAAVGGRPVDVAAQPVQGRRKRLLVADMDATIVTGETLDDLAAEAGLKDEIAAVTARAMNGDLDFEQAVRERVGRLKGLSTRALTRTWKATRLTPGAETLVATMHAHGAHAVLVSGGFTYFTKRVAEACGFDDHHGNRLETKDRALTGRVLDPILGADAKYETLVATAVRLRIPLRETLTVGDGANDARMIRAAGLGVAFHAKPVLREAARVRIDHADLTALLYIQGYRAETFVSS